MFINCTDEIRIPSMEESAHALLKSRKNSNDLKLYRSISLLHYNHKIIEKIVIFWMTEIINAKFVP